MYSWRQYYVCQEASNEKSKMECIPIQVDKNCCFNNTPLLSVCSYIPDRIKKIVFEIKYPNAIIVDIGKKDATK